MAGFAFGRFELRRRECLLLADGVPVELGNRAVEVLLALVEANGTLVTKGALLDRVWPGLVVEENNLWVQVSALRRALGPDGRDWIVTMYGRGYRFAGPVTAAVDGETTPSVTTPRDVSPEQAEVPPLSVLVLPFAAFGGNPGRDWFTDAVTDGLTTDLARTLQGSTVIARANADTYKGHVADVRAIGREQGVRYVVEGSVLLADDDRVRVNAKLVAADTGTHLWADRFDTMRHDALQAQDQIVGRLAHAVGLQMINAEAQRAEQAAHECLGKGTAETYVLRGHAAANRSMMTHEGIEAACALYAQALECAPENTDALAGIACLRAYQVVHGCLEEGRTVRDEAQAREVNLAEAEAKLKRAMAIAPRHLEVLKSRAMLLRARGRFADAIAAAEAVLAHNSGEPMAYCEIGLSLLCLKRAEEAVTWFRRADALGPGDPVRWTWLQGLGRALIQLGRDREAADALRLAVASNPTFTPPHALFAAALASEEGLGSRDTKLASESDKSSVPHASGPLTGFYVLLVEDEYVIADEMDEWLRQAGAEVVGPVPDVEQALDLIDETAGTLDAAVLDVNLGDGKTAYPIVDRLDALGVPYLFAAEYVRLANDTSNRGRPRLEKPISQRDLIRTLDHLLKWPKVTN